MGLDPWFSIIFVVCLKSNGIYLADQITKTASPPIKKRILVTFLKVKWCLLYLLTEKLGRQCSRWAKFPPAQKPALMNLHSAVNFRISRCKFTLKMLSCKVQQELRSRLKETSSVLVRYNYLFSLPCTLLSPPPFASFRD